MPNSRPLVRTCVVVVAIVVGACSSNAASPSPSPTSNAAGPIASYGAPSSAPLTPTTPSPATPSLAPPTAPPTASQVLLTGSAIEMSSDPVGITPMRGGGVFVEASSNASGSTVLTHFDAKGRSTSGWPVTLSGATACDAPMAVEDGSVRMLCVLRNTTGGQDSGRAFAFDVEGQQLSGWPVEIDDPVVASGLVGDSMRVLASVATDTEDVGATTGSYMLSIDAGGATNKGVVIPESEFCCGSMAVGPTGAAYVVRWSEDSGRSQLTAFDMNGILARFPTTVTGVASGAAFDADGNVWVVTAFPSNGTSRLAMVFDAGAPLPFATAEPQTGQTGGCESTIPAPPVIPRTGPIIVYSEVDEAVFSVGRDLQKTSGWPFTPADPLVIPRPGPESEHEAGYCPGSLAPVVGPDGTVYLSIEEHDSSAGGSLVAVGPNGRVRAGWPVGLKRAGAEFWAVNVGLDGTVYALAYEPGAGDTSTATLLAIAPDSTILYRTTIIAPG